MSTEDNKALVRRYLAALSGKDKPASMVNQYVADEDQLLKQHIADAEVGFPRYEMIMEDLVGEEDKVVVRFTMRATHQGAFMGIPATGKQVNVPGIIIYRLADGKIVEHWLQMDAVALLQQVGAMPTPG